QQLHGELYRPDNAILILTGDISAAQAQQLAQASFCDWQKPATPLPPRPACRTASRLPSILLIDQHGAGQAGVVAAHAAPPRNDADYYVGTVANAVLGGSYSARLNEEIRIKRGLSYGASLDEIGKYIAQVQAVTPKQIEKYAHKHLEDGASHVVVVGDAAQFGAAIRQQHPKAVLLESTALDLDSPSLQAPPASR